MCRMWQKHVSKAAQPRQTFEEHTYGQRIGFEFDDYHRHYKDAIDEIIFNFSQNAINIIIHVIRASAASSETAIPMCQMRQKHFSEEAQPRQTFERHT